MSEASACISAFSAALGSKPKRNFLRLHLVFALKHLYPVLGPEHKEELISEILFPLLLFSKARQHKVETVWDIIAENMNKEAGKEFEMLRGCADVVKDQQEEKDVLEKMKNMNTALSEKIAREFFPFFKMWFLFPLGFGVS